MFKSLLPKETSFFDFFEEHIKVTMEGCKELYALTSGKEDITIKASRIKEIEHAADLITHKCIETLHKTFITPIERNDIHRLIKSMDDIMDAVDSAASRIALYELTTIRSEAKALADVLVRATTELEGAVKCLRHMKNLDELKDKCIKMHYLENEGDALLRSALMKLFREEEKNPILVIKWKEIYERLEKATDHCEHVANILEGVMIEST